jgi:hypothetical protein
MRTSATSFLGEFDDEIDDDYGDDDFDLDFDGDNNYDGDDDTLGGGDDDFDHLNNGFQENQPLRTFLEVQISRRWSQEQQQQHQNHHNQDNNNGNNNMTNNNNAINRHHNRKRRPRGSLASALASGERMAVLVFLVAAQPQAVAFLARHLVQPPKQSQPPQPPQSQPPRPPQPTGQAIDPLGGGEHSFTDGQIPSDAAGAAGGDVAVSSGDAAVADTTGETATASSLNLFTTRELAAWHCEAVVRLTPSACSVLVPGIETMVQAFKNGL